jgi:VWFA-related protein
MRLPLLLALLFVLASLSPCLAQEVRAELPSNNLIRIENRRGDVSVDVWNDQHVSVTAAFAGEPPRNSPVIIRRTEHLLNVMIASDATSPSPTRVSLRLSVPARSRIEIITNGGGVNVVGVPAMLNAQTLSGAILFKFSTQASPTSISARAPLGKISASIPDSAPVTDVPKFESGRVKGDKQIRLASERGSIEIRGGLDFKTSENETAAATKPPVLTGNTAVNQGAGIPAGPSTGEPQEIDEGDVIRVDTELVTLNVSVVERTTSRGLKGLVKNDFKLFEDGVEQQIGHFEASNAPFNLVLLIDLSGSTKDKLELIKNAAQHFVDAARTEDSIAVITFAATPSLVSPLTNDRQALRRRIRAIETSQGDTKLYDSLNFAMTDALKDASRSRRNAVVVMSDGLDGTLPSVKGDGSAMSYSEILSQIREFDGVLYSIWVDTEYVSLSDHDTQPEDFDAGHDRMAEMADAGGGLFYEVAKLEDLAGAYEKVVADIGTVYSLAYRPTNEVRDGKWRAIRVKVLRPDAVPRGKSGYYAK